MIIAQSKSFKKDSTKFTMSDKHYTKFIEYLYLLSNEKNLPPEAVDHKLTGDWTGFRECHISGDLLLIYRVFNNQVELIRIGTHTQLFD